MKNLSLVIFSLLLLGFTNSVLAVKDAKIVRHCGCVYDSLGEPPVDMVFHDVSVSGNSKGHGNHLVDSDSLCFAGLDEDVAVYELWVRTADDCMVSGSNDGLSVCVEEQEFDTCGVLFEEPE